MAKDSEPSPPPPVRHQRRAVDHSSITRSTQPGELPAARTIHCQRLADILADIDA